MSKHTIKTLAATLLLSASLGHSAIAAESISQEQAQEFISAHVSTWINDGAVIEAIKNQNQAHQALSDDEVKALDDKWRADDQELIGKTTENALSALLKEKQGASEGIITELFIMDNKGLNVGQSGLTSDYWQGDEAKWQETFSKGPSAIHISEIEFDESSQSYQVQISTTISDGETAIGAITLGVDAESLE